MTVVSIAASITLAAKVRPSFLVILTDDQGYGDLALHGNPVVETPRMDARNLAHRHPERLGDLIQRYLRARAADASR